MNTNQLFRVEGFIIITPMQVYTKTYKLKELDKIYNILDVPMLQIC